MIPPPSIWRRQYPNTRWPGCDVETDLREEVRTAFGDGRLKSQPCMICGSWASLAHHTDYERTLEVIFLCHAHHVVLHSRLRKRFIQSGSRGYTQAFHDRVLAEIQHDYQEPSLIDYEITHSGRGRKKAVAQ